jgi:hypothetical protein
MAQHPDDLNEPIHDLCELLDLLDNDLNRAPAWKQTSKWYRDRLAERNRLVLRLADLRDQQQALLNGMPEVAMMPLGIR